MVFHMMCNIFNNLLTTFVVLLKKKSERFSVPSHVGLHLKTADRRTTSAKMSLASLNKCSFQEHRREE
jgi:hypothetical protein